MGETAGALIPGLKYLTSSLDLAQNMLRGESERSKGSGALFSGWTIFFSQSIRIQI